MESLFTYFKILNLVLCFAFTASAKEEALPPVQFSKTKITLSGKTIQVELAETPEQRSRGLMFREKMGADEGMLFIFENEQMLSFWMKNTFIDLAIGYFDKNRTLVDVQEMKKTNSVMDQNLPSYTSARPAMYALEMNKGWFEKNKVKLGSRFEFLPAPGLKSKSGNTK